MGRIGVLTLLALLVGGLLAVSGGARPSISGEPAPAAFRLLDGSAGCSFDGSAVSCSSRSGATAVLEEDGTSHASGEAAAWDAESPVLRRTESWWHGGFSCRVVGDQIVCERGSGSIAVGAHGVGGASSSSD